MFKIGDKVKGIYERYNEMTGDYEKISYMGTIKEDFKDGSFTIENLVDDNKYSILVELYYGETMERVTK